MMDNKRTILLILGATAIAVSPALAEAARNKHSKPIAATSSTTVSSTNAVEAQVNPAFGGTITAGPNSGRITELSPDGTSMTGSMINNSNNLPSAVPRSAQ